MRPALPVPTMTAKIVVGKKSRRVAIAGTRTGGRRMRDAGISGVRKAPPPAPSGIRVLKRRPSGVPQAPRPRKIPPPGATGPTRIVAVSLPASLLGEVDAFAARVQMQRSTLIRQALLAFMARIEHGCARPCDEACGVQRGGGR